LPQDVRLLTSSLASENFEELRELAHRIAGTAGMYGFMSLSKAAAAIEAQLVAKTPMPAVARQIQALIDQIRAVPGYDRSKEQT
jgi:HPt (histidine-containing phosphotransfer) domain-containing protein